MRALIVAGSFHPEIGGPPRYLNALARELIARGHQVEVVCMSPAGVAAPAEDYPFPVRRISRGLWLPLRLATMLAAIMRRGRQADLILISDYGTPMLIANRILKKPTIIKIVGDFAWEWARRHGLTAQDFDEFQSTPQRGRIRMVQRIQRAYVMAADRVLTPSHYLAHVVAGWGVPPLRITVIHNAIDPERFARAADPAAIRARYLLPPRYLLAIARLTPWKGIDVLIDLLPRLSSDVHLVVAGDGPERENLQERARVNGVESRVQLLGAVPFDEISALLAETQCLVLYTGYEGLSHVLLEGLAAGVPIIASDKGGNREVVTHGQSGLLVPYGDQEALMRAISSVIEDPALRERLARGARAASDAFSWAHLRERTIAMMEETIRHGRRESGSAASERKGATS